jgi:hypothetical protein
LDSLLVLLPTVIVFKTKSISFFADSIAASHIDLTIRYIKQTILCMKLLDFVYNRSEPEQIKNHSGEEM